MLYSILLYISGTTTPSTQLLSVSCLYLCIHAAIKCYHITEELVQPHGCKTDHWLIMYCKNFTIENLFKFCDIQNSFCYAEKDWTKENSVLVNISLNIRQTQLTRNK